MAKKIIILKHNGGRFANQLFLYATVLAYCIEKKYDCVNYPFYSYRKYFNLKASDPIVTALDSIALFPLHSRHWLHFTVYSVYKMFVPVIKLVYPGDLLTTRDDEEFALPPTKNFVAEQVARLKQIETSVLNRCYLEGWGFRDPVGLKKHHAKIVTHLAFKKKYLVKAEKFKKSLKDDYIVGVHIRQGDFKTFAGGKYFLGPISAVKLLRKLSPRFAERAKGKRIKYIIFSDENINLNSFKDMETVRGLGSMIDDFVLLTKCDIIVGSSTFSEFAAYYGSVPYISFHGSQLNNFYNLPC